MLSLSGGVQSYDHRKSVWEDLGNAIKDSKNMKKIIIFIFIILVLVGGLFYFVNTYFPITKKEIRTVTVQEMRNYDSVATDTKFVPEFKEIPLDFNHRYNEEKDLAFVGSSLIDIDQDGVDEVFIGGGRDQTDALFSFKNNKFENITPPGLLSSLAKKVPSYGAISLDINKDDRVDLLVAKEDGLYLYLNEINSFKEQKLDILTEGSVPLSLTAADINKDGFVDLYLSQFINKKQFRSVTFNASPSFYAKNLLLLNQQDNTFKDISETSGLDLRQNVFQSSFIDLNNDGW